MAATPAPDSAPPPAGERLDRARLALTGLSIGDAFGERCSGYQAMLPQLAARRLVPPAPWPYTDDTELALSIFSSLRQHGGIDQDALARSFADHYDRTRGYGAGARELLSRIRLGADWRAAASRLFGGEGSRGNGAAMRVAPVGAYFADDLAAAVEHARLSAEVTHTHPEGVAGAIAGAVAAAWAWRLRSAPTRPSRADFLALVLPHLPPSQVRAGVALAHDLHPSTPVRRAVQLLGNGGHVTAPDTLPFTLWCAGELLHDYAEALWLTASGGGDVDTNCAIVGGIVALYVGPEGIPPDWRQRREPLPAWHDPEAADPPPPTP